MSRDVVEVIYGKYYKFEIVRKAGGLLSSPTFWIYRDGQYFKGSYSSLAYAVEVAKSQG